MRCTVLSMGSERPDSYRARPRSRSAILLSPLVCETQGVIGIAVARGTAQC